MGRKPNVALTTSRQDVLDAYKRHIKKHGEAPSLQQLADALDQSRTNVHYHLGKLRELGYIEGVAKITIIRPKVTAKGRRA